MNNHRYILHSLLALGTAASLSSCAIGTSKPNLDGKTAAVVRAMSDKLAAAKTLRASVTRTASPGFNVGITVAESVTGTVVVQRPDRAAADLKTSEGHRSLAFDGSQFMVVDHAAGTHSTVSAAGDIDQVVRSIEKTYGVMPPVGELLANRPEALLLEGVKTGSWTGTESIQGVACDHLSFKQERLSWELWVGTSDKLPHRISIAYPNGEGGAPLVMTATIKNWVLDGPVSGAELKVQPPAGSRAIDMLLVK